MPETHTPPPATIPAPAQPTVPGRDEQSLLSWSARSQPHHDRSQRWYLVAGIVVLAGAAYGIVTGSWSLAIVLLLCGATYFLLRGHEPPQRAIAIFEEGIIFDGAFSPWQEFASYWLIRTPHYTELHIRRKNRRRGEVIIQLGTMDAEVVRFQLSRFLTENSEAQEGLLDIFIRVCKL